MAVQDKPHIRLFNGEILQYHKPRHESVRIPDSDLEEIKAFEKIEVEIGPGKGQFLKERALKYPDRAFVGIDRRGDRIRSTQKKLLHNDLKNCWIYLLDANDVELDNFPELETLHLYHPDPWPKGKHHKHRFLRSPHARKWVNKIKLGGSFSFSTDHEDYFKEALDIFRGWQELQNLIVYQKNAGRPWSGFEQLFLAVKKQPVYKARFRRI